MNFLQLQGVGFGLGTAFCQSVFYLFTRRFVLRTGRTPLLLLIVSHATMGGFSALLLLALRPHNLPPLTSYGLPLASTVAFYVIAQFALFRVLREVEGSRIAPLLGSKIIVLALLSVFCLGQTLRPLQWLAVLISAGAAWLLNEAGSRIPWRLLSLMGLTVLGYCLSDLSIGTLVKRLASVGPSMPLVAAALTYLTCGVLTLPFAFRREARDRQVWSLAVPCALAWFGAMCLLYASFAAIGVVFGNIVQSTRGLISVGLGWTMVRIGHTHLEAPAAQKVFWRRLAGAALMLLAVVLYLLKG